MNRNRLLAAAAAALVIFAAMSSRDARAEGWGNIKGQFVLDGEVPPPKLLVKKGDPNVKDAACCAKQDVPSDELVVDPVTKGIQHIFVYLRRAPAIHPDLAEPKEKEVVFDQVGCRFVPHTLFIRAGQTVVLKSNDGCAHNTNATFFRNQSFNVLIPPKERKGLRVTLTAGEFLPSRVECNIHPWMSARWLVLDHPYAAITDAEGRFEIQKLPAGEHSFYVWHEIPGYVTKGFEGLSAVKPYKRGFTVVVEDGKTTDIGVVKVPKSVFEQ